jgi:hypothetical protein
MKMEEPPMLVPEAQRETLEQDAERGSWPREASSHKNSQKGEDGCEPVQDEENVAFVEHHTVTSGSEPRSSVNSLTAYEQDREKLRNGVPLTIFFFVRATTGIGFFINQYPQLETGPWLGLSIMAVCVALSAWGMVLLCALASLVENKKGPNSKQVGSYLDLVERIMHEKGKWLKIAVGCSVIGGIIASITGNLILCIDKLSSEMTVSQWSVHLAIYLFVLILIILISEPERFAIIFTLMFLLIATMFLAILGRNINYLADHHTVPHWDYVNFEGIFLSLAMNIYIFETSATVLNIRRTMKNPEVLPTIIKCVLPIMGLFMWVFGFMYVLEYGRYDI